jgi:hypothetical protein
VSEKIKGIYFLISKECNVVKIGKSIDIEKRFHNIKTMSPSNLIAWYEETNDLKLEGILHKRFKEFRKHGEWFEYSQELISYISNNCKYLTGSKNKFKQVNINNIQLHDNNDMIKTYQYASFAKSYKLLMISTPTRFVCNKKLIHGNYLYTWNMYKICFNNLKHCNYSKGVVKGLAEVHFQFKDLYLSMKNNSDFHDTKLYKELNLYFGKFTKDSNSIYDVMINIADPSKIMNKEFWVCH